MAREEQEFDFIDPTTDFPGPTGDQTPKDDQKPQAKPGASDEIDLEVVDDTPPEDRNRQPVPDTELEPTQAELQQFSQRDRNTLAKLRQARHDERRRAEQAERERQAAIDYARAVQTQLQSFQQRYATDAASAVQQLAAGAENEVTSLKAQLEKAYEEGNAKQVADLTDRLTDAKAKLWQYRTYQPQVPQVQQVQPAGQPQNVDVQTAPTPQPVTPDARAVEWKDKNPWFMSDPEMTNAAFGVHEKLVRVDRLDPSVEPDEYYERLDARMRQLFPDKFTASQPQPNTRRSSSPPVAGVNRSTVGVTNRNGKTVVQLTKSQLAVAESLGIPPKAYAAELLRLSRENPNG